MLEFDTWHSKVLGVVLDLSLQHAADGRRILDHVKNAMASYIRTEFDNDDIVYVYHPEVIEPTIFIGTQVASIQNYETDGWNFDLNFALKQTLYILAVETNLDKIFLYFTDRMKNASVFKRLLALDKKEDVGCRFVIVGIGNHYNRKDIEELPVTFLHVDDVVTLKDQLKGVLQYGPNTK